MRYEFHPEARVEYLDAVAYYEGNQPSLGVRFTLEIEDTIQRIIEAPKRWRAVDSEVRRCLAHMFPYGVLYSIEAGYILILAVMHHSRRPGYWHHRVG